jgi:hypothetical protein
MSAANSVFASLEAMLRKNQKYILPYLLLFFCYFTCLVCFHTHLYGDGSLEKQLLWQGLIICELQTIQLLV